MWKEWIGRANRLQKNRRFMLVATTLVVLVSGVSYSIWLASAIGQGDAATTLTQSGAPSAQQSTEDQTLAQQPRLTADALRAKVRASSAWVTVGVATAAVTLFAVLVIWLGLSFTALGLTLAATLIAGPLSLFDSTQGLARLVFGMIVLTASFSVLVQALRAILSQSDTPILAIARNVLDEAVRMKIGLVFIVALIFMLAALPGMLDEAQPLRYRVQSFLQYSTTTTFWVLALLSLFFSVSTVAFEQRDRVIWQTMCKPVTPMGYLVGKWIGVMALNLALLSVSALGVFFFVDYLREQPATGEIRPYVTIENQPGVTLDRRILETEVLTARTGSSVDPPQIDMKMVQTEVQRQLQEAEQRDYALRDNESLKRRFIKDTRQAIVSSAVQRYRAVAPGGQRTFVFSGLGKARRYDRPLTVRYKINAGSDVPGDLYRLVFVTRAGVAKEQVPLGIMQTFSISPDAIDEDGKVVISLYNGDPQLGAANPLTITFPPDGFEVLYTVGTYESNFLRVTATMWIKLGFITAVGVSAATFLSFPVACMLTLLVLFAAESSGFLKSSLEEYPLHDQKGAIDWVAVVMNLIAGPITRAFRVYSDLRPTAKLVDGRLISWATLARGVGVVGLWSMISIVFGWLVFRKRELAIYSGH